jgi:hypothetical protein
MFPHLRIEKPKLTLLAIVIAIWTAFGLFFGTQGYIREVYFGRNASLTGYIISWIICGYAWAVMTYPVLVFARKFSLERLKWPRFFLIHVPAAVLFAMAQLAIYLLIAGILFRRADRGLWDFYSFLLANELQSSVLVYFAVVSAVTVYDKFFRKQDIEYLQTTQSEILGPLTPAPVPNSTNGFLRRIPIKENGKIVLVDTDQIDWIESYGNYLFLHTPARKYLHRETMAAMERKLDPERFVRIRRSTIVKVDEIKELHPTDNGQFEILLSCGNTLFSTRRYRKNLESLLKS